MEKLAKQAEMVQRKLKEIIKNDSLVFPIFTDLHTEKAECEVTDRLIKALSIVTLFVKADAVINLGDNLEMLGRRDKTPNDELRKILSDLFGLIYENINCPMITVNGNHDAIGTDFFKPDFWNGIVRGKYGAKNARYSKTGSYYYIDYDKADTRLVILSMPYESDLEAEHPTPLWKFGENQLEWLKNEALDTEKYVIVLCHAPIYYEYNGGETRLLEVFTGERVAYSHYANLCGWLEDRDEAVEIIKNSKAKIVCCLSGHTHKDSLWEPLEEKEGHKNPLPCYQAVTGRACGVKPQNGYGVIIDIAVWTPSEKKLSLIRFGDGEDREINL